MNICLAVISFYGHNLTCPFVPLMLFSVAEKIKKGRGKVHSTIILYHLFGLTDIQLTFHVTFAFCSTDVFLVYVRNNR